MDKEAILDKHISCICDDMYKSRGMADPHCPRHSCDDSISDAMDSYAAELKKENEKLTGKVTFYREATDKCREFVFGRNDIGHPNQPLWDAVHDKLTQLQSIIEAKDEEIKKYVGIAEALMESATIIDKQKQEIERLKGLIKKVHGNYLIADHKSLGVYLNKESLEIKWQQFKTENNL